MEERQKKIELLEKLILNMEASKLSYMLEILDAMIKVKTMDNSKHHV